MENADNLFVSADDFSVKNVTYAKPRTNPSGGKNVAVMDSSIKKQLAISTPLMLTWGVNEWMDDATGKKSYDLSLQFPRDSDDNFAKCQKLLASLKEFEDKLLEDALVHSKEWFGKKYDLAPVVEALFTPMLRYSKDKNTGDVDYTRAPSLRVKMPYWDGKYNVELYDMHNNMIFPNVEDESLSPTTLISKGQKIAAIIKCGGIWFANGKFGVTWKLVQAVVQPRVSLRGKCHIRLDASERSTLEATARQADPEEDDDDVCVATEVDNSDNEEDPPQATQQQSDPPVEDDAAEEKPAEKPAKKRVVKKKLTTK